MYADCNGELLGYRRTQGYVSCLHYSLIWGYPVHVSVCFFFQFVVSYYLQQIPSEADATYSFLHRRDLMYTKSYVLLHIQSLVTDVHLHKEFYEHFYVFSVYTHTLLLRVHHAKEYIYIHTHTVQSFSNPTKVFLNYWHECLLKYTLYILYMFVHLISCICIHFLHSISCIFAQTYSCIPNHLILLLVLIAIGVLYDFRVISWSFSMLWWRSYERLRLVTILIL